MLAWAQLHGCRMGLLQEDRVRPGQVLSPGLSKSHEVWQELHSQQESAAEQPGPAPSFRTLPFLLGSRWLQEGPQDQQASFHMTPVDSLPCPAWFL